MRTHKTAICVLLSVLCGVFCKEKTAPVDIPAYEDATIPLDLKNTTIEDIPLIVNRSSVPLYRESVGDSSTSVATDVSGVTDAPGKNGEHKAQEITNSTGKGSSKIIDPFSVKLLRGETNGISVTDVSRSKSILYFNYTQAKAYSVDYHFEKRLVFFAAVDVIFRDVVVGRLTRVKPPTVVVSAGVDGPVRLAVDWVHDRLYWLSDKHQTVEVADLDGANRTLLFDNLQDIKFPNNIAVDPYAGYLFLVSNYSVYRADLDGANLTRLQLQGEETRGVKCLALDIRGHRVFYSGKEGKLETGIPYIASCDYEGSACHDHPLAYKWNDIFALDVFRDTLYFASYRPGVPDKLYSADLKMKRLNPKHLQSVDSSRGGLWSVRVYHPAVQKDHKGQNCSEASENEKHGA